MQSTHCSSIHWYPQWIQTFSSTKYVRTAGLQLVHTTLWQSDDESDDAEVELQSRAAHIELIIPFTASANKLRDADKKNWKQDLLQ